jgi:NAD-dependent SIR2 family protein deacetylase
MATTSVSNTTAGSSNVPTFQQTEGNWNANIAQAMQFYQAQVQMDKEQQSIAFASNVEAKGNQMLMACIQNIR